MGRTPYHDEFIEPGRVSIRLFLDYYKIIKDTIVLGSGESAIKEYHFRTHEVWEDSVYDVRKVKRRRIRTVAQIGIGAAGLSFLYAALHSEHNRDQAISNQANLRAEYATASTNFNYYHNEDVKLNQEISTSTRRRKVYTILSSICAGGFAITFFF